MEDPFLVAAGPSPARADAGRWRQVALLATAAVVGDDPRARIGLSAALAALDRPLEAAAVAGGPDDGAWAVWWGVLAAGAAGGPDALEAALMDAGTGATDDGDPDAREVRRRLEDLRTEAAEIAGGGDGAARFALVGQGTGAGGGLRAVLVGRSSAVFLIEPSWESLRLVRLAPSDGPAAGNRAHSPLHEVLAAVRRGEQRGREMPPDEAPPLVPEELLGALREGAAERDRRLLALAEEVQEERAQLAEAWERLEAERIAVMAEQRRRARATATPNGARRRPSDIAVPSDRPGAAALLGVAPDARGPEVERAYRDQIARCHPDRVAEMHPRIRAQAEGLTVALNTARDLLLGRGPRR